jgi:hypothetical protein
MPGIVTITLVKIMVSVLIVVSLSLIAERAGPRAAGIISGYPLGAAISLFFIGWEIGPGFASESAMFTMAGLSALVAFVGGYLIGVDVIKTDNRLAGVALATMVACLTYFATAWVLSRFRINGVNAPLIAVICLVLSARMFRNIPDVKIQQAAGFSFKITLIRAGFAALAILAITTSAQAVGARWAGLFSSFPITLFPLLVIIHYTYQAEHVRTIIKNVPRGLGALLIYLFVVAKIYPGPGLFIGTVLGYLAATIYLMILEYGRLLRPRRHIPR